MIVSLMMQYISQDYLVCHMKQTFLGSQREQYQHNHYSKRNCSQLLARLGT